MIILDDIISTGGTICAAAEAVRKQGAKSVLAFCVHAIFASEAAQKLQDAGVAEIVGTNTVPSKFSKVDVSEAIVAHLKTLDE